MTVPFCCPGGRADHLLGITFSGGWHRRCQPP
jgi:hypothetical protein